MSSEPDTFRFLRLPPDVPNVEVGRGGASANTIRRRREQKDRGLAMVRAQPQSSVLHNHQTNVEAVNQSLFDNLPLQVDRFAGQQLPWIKESKVRYRTARLNTAETELVASYAPYAFVKDRNIKAHLCHIAKLFQYIDKGFAEYFQVVVSRLPRHIVEGYLESARSKVEKKQARSPPDTRPGSSLDLGDLGNFCEKVFDGYASDNESRVLYETTDCLQEQLLHYLQDAFEIPYWQFMLDLFLQQNDHSRSLSATVVFRALSSLKIEILHKRDTIRRAASEENRGEDIEPLLRGIDAHVAVLEEVWHKDTSEFEASELLQTLFRTIEPDRPSPPTEVEPSTPAKLFPAWPANQNSDLKDTIVFIALFAFFFIASLIPGYLAFSIAINIPDTGHTSDADFWSLVQSSVISVLGSLMTVIPLMRGSWFTAAHTVTWVLWGAGCACAIISVGLYPVCNTAYSSAVSYFGSVFSLMAVLATTQVVPKPIVSIIEKAK